VTLDSDGDALSAPSDSSGPADPPVSITQILQQAATGDRGALDCLIPLLYEDLRRIAHRQLGRLRPGQTLNTTGLVSEAYLRLAGRDAGYADRAHFFAVSATAMRQILVDHSRRRGARKRGGGMVPVTLDESVLAADAEAEQVLAVEQALSRLTELDPRLVQVVECRVFAGYTEEETAEALGLSLRSTQRYWSRARAWLKEELLVE
jgi:RNA polymerase sigma factor (TIGR02999 family)